MIVSGEAVSLTDGLYYEVKTDKGWKFDLGALVGFQADYKKLSTRLILQSANLFSKRPELDIGFSLLIRKVLTFSAEVKDAWNPRLSLELSKKFYKDNELAVGFVSNHILFNTRFGYITTVLVNKLTSLTVTFLFNDKQFGAMAGATFSWRS